MKHSSGVHCKNRIPYIYETSHILRLPSYLYGTFHMDMTFSHIHMKRLFASYRYGESSYSYDTSWVWKVVEIATICDMTSLAPIWQILICTWKMVALKFQLTVNLTRRQLSSYPYDKDHIDMISYVIFVRHLAARCRCFQPDLACFRPAPDLPLAGRGTSLALSWYSFWIGQRSTPHHLQEAPTAMWRAWTRRSQWDHWTS